MRLAPSDPASTLDVDLSRNKLYHKHIERFGHLGYAPVLMPHVTPDDVRHVAFLARIALTDAEVAQLQEQLGRILEYVTQLQSLDTTDVPPTSHVLPLTNVLRDDVVRPSLPPETIAALAAGRQGHFIKVPRVIE